jgi:hypothetical protein
VYRSAVVVRTQAEVVDQLLVELARVTNADPRACTPAVIRCFLTAAALESALADLEDPDADTAAEVSDAIAEAVLSGDVRPLTPLRPSIARVRVARRLRLTVPEGFAYYSLSPRRFAAHAAAHAPAAELVVVGIRTIGCALGAMTAAAIRASRERSHSPLPRVAGLFGTSPPVTRISVRPRGHPYERTLVLAGDRRARVLAARDRGASFLVVDEGPGLSGSSFLAVAEALVAAGVPASRIRMQGTRPIDDPTTLVTPRASERWRFGYTSVDAYHEVRPGERNGSGGAWRAILCAGEPPPLAWPNTERCKSLAPGVLRKFEGLGTYGEAVCERARALAEAGWCPPVIEPVDADGFVSYALVPGRLLRGLPGPGSARERVVRHLARYLAARTRIVSLAGTSTPDEACMAAMTSANVTLELGRSWNPIALPRVEVPVVPDARLQPHEWIATPDGRLYKADAAAHGDDHFFPGPTDSAWDVAGAILEWDMTEADRSLLLAGYRDAAGDDVSARLPAYLVAYAAFRARMCLMAAHDSPPADAAGWRRAHARHAAQLRAALRAVRAPGTSSPGALETSPPSRRVYRPS